MTFQSSKVIWSHMMVLHTNMHWGRVHLQHYTDQSILPLTVIGEFWDHAEYGGWRKLFKKGKVTVLSPHPGSELCSADFDKYLPWSLGLYSPYNHLDIHLNSLGSIQPLTRKAYKSALSSSHWLLGQEKQCSMKCLAQGHKEQMHRQGIDLATWPRS